jgi:hypothetical protein
MSETHKPSETQYFSRNFCFHNGPVPQAVLLCSSLGGGNHSYGNVSWVAYLIGAMNRLHRNSLITQKAIGIQKLCV